MTTVASLELTSEGDREMLLEERRALVTGGSGVIGHAVALELARHGADVAVFASRREDAARVADEIKGLGRRATSLAGDVRSRSDVQQAVALAIKRLRSVDILVNAEEIDIKPAPIEKVTDEEWTRVMETNVRGPLFFAQELAPHFRLRGRGAIVNVAALCAKYKPERYVSAAYVASETALCALTRQLAVKLGPLGVRVNAVLHGHAPSSADSNGPNGPTKREQAQLLRALPLGRYGHPQDQAAAVVWLVADLNTWITGESIAVSGGERLG